MAAFAKLRAWQLAHQLVLAVYRGSAGFPATERYGITSQMRRAAVSVAANIVEGSSKRGPREYRRFLDVALGSLAELRYLLLLAKDLGYLAPGDWARLDEQHKETGRVIWALYRAVSRATVGEAA